MTKFPLLKRLAVTLECSPKSRGDWQDGGPLELTDAKAALLRGMFPHPSAAEQIRRINDLTDEQAQARCSTTGRGMAGRISLLPMVHGPTAGAGGSWIWKDQGSAPSLYVDGSRKYPLVNLIGATADDARDIMTRAKAGFLPFARRRASGL